jgi:hypothetical protein
VHYLRVQCPLSAMVALLNLQDNMQAIRGRSISMAELSSISRLADTRESLQCLLSQEEKHYLLAEAYILPSKDLHRNTNNRELQESTCPALSAEQCARVVSDLAFSSSPRTRGTGCESLQDAYPSSICVKELADSQVSPQPASSHIIGFWRQQMLEWSYLVMDSFGIDREVVAVSFNLLDRYVAKEIKSNIPITREDFQLFSMTCLFIGVKLLESFPRKITADALVAMSRGFYASEDIAQTEQDILKTLGFYLNPTTVFGFCRIYWNMFPLTVSFSFKASCQTMAEAALSDTFFMTKKPSTIGLAVVLHAARNEGYQDAITHGFLAELQDILDVPAIDDFGSIYQRLEMLFNKP